MQARLRELIKKIVNERSPFEVEMGFVGFLRKRRLQFEIAWEAVKRAEVEGIEVMDFGPIVAESYRYLNEFLKGGSPMAEGEGEEKAQAENSDVELERKVAQIVRDELRRILCPVVTE